MGSLGGGGAAIVVKGYSMTRSKEEDEAEGDGFSVVAAGPVGRVLGEQRSGGCVVVAGGCGEGGD